MSFTHRLATRGDLARIVDIYNATIPSRQAMVHVPSIRVDTLLGFIFGHNEPSPRLFEKFGFARWGELPKVAALDGVERDLIIVGRRA